MSKYTTEVRYICETAAGLDASVGYTSIDKVLDKAIPAIFDFDFPLFDPAYKDTLCRKILKHYYTREISEETVGLWKLRLDTKLNEIMPYYNQLYNSELIKFNPMYDVDLTTKHNRTNTGSAQETSGADISRTKTGSRDATGTTHDEGQNEINSEGHSTGSTSATKDHQDSYSDTPQGSLEGVLTGEYLTNARRVLDTESGLSSDDNNAKSTGSTSSDGRTTSKENTSESESVDESRNRNETTKGNEDYFQTVTGKTAGGSYSKMLQEFRETFLNIDMMVIDALEPLFFGLW